MFSDTDMCYSLQLIEGKFVTIIKDIRTLEESFSGIHLNKCYKCEKLIEDYLSMMIAHYSPQYNGHENAKDIQQKYLEIGNKFQNWIIELKTGDYIEVDIHDYLADDSQEEISFKKLIKEKIVDIILVPEQVGDYIFFEVKYIETKDNYYRLEDDSHIYLNKLGEKFLASLYKTWADNLP